jgi:hypothetical protein
VERIEALPRRTEPGDLLRISAAADLAAEAQVIKANNGALLLGVFQIGEMHEEVPILLVETGDGFVRSGRWEHLGHQPVMDIPEPLFQMPFSDGDGRHLWIRDFEGNPIREATAEEWGTLREGASFSPAAVEKGIRAFAGIEKWLPAFDAMMF